VLVYTRLRDEQHSPTVDELSLCSERTGASYYPSVCTTGDGGKLIRPRLLVNTNRPSSSVDSVCLYTRVKLVTPLDCVR
jgi:hypothetical protein